MTVRGISFSAVEALLKAPTPMLETLLNHMELKLTDIEWVRTHVREEDTNPTFVFTHIGTVSDGDKLEIKRAFIDNGWNHVEVTNSVEDGERPGMIGIEISRFTRRQP